MEKTIYNTDADTTKAMNKYDRQTIEVPITDRRRDFSTNNTPYQDAVAKTLVEADDQPDDRSLEQRIKDCFINPAPGRFIVEIDNFQYKGKLVVPSTTKRINTTGRVLRIGPGVDMLQVGDRIVFGLWSGTAIHFEGKPIYRTLGNGEWLGIVEDDNVRLEKVEA